MALSARKLLSRNRLVPNVAVAFPLMLLSTSEDYSSFVINWSGDKYLSSSVRGNLTVRNSLMLKSCS